MNKNSKIEKHLPLQKNYDGSKRSASETSPSMNVNNEPVAENDNSPNLFEEHIREKKNDAC